MGHTKTTAGKATRATLGACVIALLLCALASPASAAPSHPPVPAQDITGLNHACGVAIDSKGDLYASSAGESKVNVYDPSHNLLTSISDTHEPCGLAVTTTGNLYVSEKATGEVARYKPNAYPFAGTPAYGEREVIDASTKAKGIAVDPFDNRLYVAEGTKVAVYTSEGNFEANIGEGLLAEATGVAAYTYRTSNLGTDRYLWVADAAGLAADRLYLFGGTEAKALQLRRELKGANTPDGSFGFGAAGAYLAADPGNREAAGDKCIAVAEQACTAGHLFLYDAAHKALDEFDASGEYLGQAKNEAFADAEPGAVAIDRSGGANDGTIYVTAGSGSGAKALAFGPLKAPARTTLGTPISKVLVGANSVATDSRGYVYVATGPLIAVYKPDGTEVVRIRPSDGKKLPLITDNEKPYDLAVDSTGKVYVLDEAKGLAKEAKVTYYTPGAYPPVDGTTYTRHAPSVATPEDFPKEFDSASILKGIAVNPGPGPGKDRLFLTSTSITHLYDSAANGSGLLDGEFAKGAGSSRQSIAVNGQNGNVYFGVNTGTSPLISVVSPDGKEVLARINEAGSPKGPGGANPYVAVDQSNGHVIEFDGKISTAREYDASGAFVAEFGNFTEGLTGEYRLAVDNSCATHEPLLSGKACEEFDPANGTAYVAWDDTNPSNPPYDVTAFGGLSYPEAGEPPAAATGTANEFGPGVATLHGTVDPKGTLLGECKFEYLTEAEYQTNGETFAGAEEEACAESPAEIGTGTKPVPVHAHVEGLAEVPYRFRLVASNTGGASEGEAVLFGAPQIEALSPLPILYHEANLRAKVNPSGLASEYRFDFVDAQSFEEQGGFEGPATRHSAWSKLAAGEASVQVSAAIVGLTEGTEYRYRAVAKNDDATTEEPTQSFTTQIRRGAEECANGAYRFGLSATLPDCRAYELVTPAETGGALVYSLDSVFNNWLTLPRGVGAGEAFGFLTTTTLPGFEGSGVIDGYRSERGAGAHPEGGWSAELVSPSYVQGGGSGGGANALGDSPDQLYSFWRVTPLYSLEGGLPEGTYLRTPAGFEAAGQGSLGTDLGATSQFVSAGGAHVIFSSKAHLEAEAPSEGTTAIYDRAAGEASAEVVSVLPDGSPTGGTYLGTTEDGSAVAFSAAGALYLHREGATVQIAGTPATFAGVSEDGTRVFYADAADGESPAALYACDVQEGNCAGPEQDQEPTEITAEGVFAAVSPDGSHAFFSSGAHNLYAWDNTETRFVGQLSAADFGNAAFAGISEMNLAAWTKAIRAGEHSGRSLAPTRSTPDGGAFVFQSHARLTSYDNEGVGEIYRYEPAAAEGERLLCVSCDPSGTPPDEDALLEDIRFASGIKQRTVIPNVTDDGSAVFFQSPDRLLPEDANEAEDVYEWRAKGSGSPECTRPGGCLALVSSGQGEANSYLYSMSADGHDVFFRTQEKLVGMDVPGSFSIYDAREGGGIPEPSTPAPCQGDACQGNGTEVPSIPSSATTGTGEEAEAPKARPCAKGKHRVKGRCVKPHKKKNHAKKHHRRAKHDRRAGK